MRVRVLSRVVMSETRSVAAGERRLDVETALADVTRRLVGRFSPRLPAPVVEETVRACAARWHDARVTEFVPLFVERRSIERLRALAAEPAQHGGRASGDASEGLGRVA